MSQNINGFENTNVLVVGGAGFVGSNLVKLIFKHSNDTAKVTVVDNLMSSEKFNLPENRNLTFVEGSITDDKVLGSIKDEFDYVFHLATYHGNQSSIFDPLADHENNTLTTLKLLERIKSFKKMKKVVYSSAGCSVAKKTFDDAVATTEESPIEIKQDSPYSISKIIGEFYMVYYNKQHSTPTVRARFQNVYGPGEVLGAGKWRGTYATVWRNVTPTFIYKALKGQPITLENDGVATRDFIFVEDICRGLMLCALNGASGDVYNIGSGKENSIKDLATIINKLTENTAGFEHLPKRPWDSSGKRFASTDKSKRVLGFEAEVSLEQGLRKTIEWTRENFGLIEKTVHKHEESMKRC